MNNFPKIVKIVEVGPRDGLQNECHFLSTNEKVILIEKLKESGIQCIESGAFVSPKWVPQMENTSQVLRALKEDTSNEYPVLTPNMHGYFAAKDSGAKTIAVFIAATESFSKKNTNCSIKDALRNVEQIITQAKQDNIKVRGYLSCAIDCPYEGVVPITRVKELATILCEYGVYEISLGDTTGTGTAKRVSSMLSEVLMGVPRQKIAVHFHDTYGQALANTLTALQMGISIVDSSIGGLGGCPYAKGASGNLATEDLVYMLEGLGISTGINLDKLCRISQWLANSFDISIQSKVALAYHHKESIM